MWTWIDGDSGPELAVASSDLKHFFYPHLTSVSLFIKGDCIYDSGKPEIFFATSVILIHFSNQLCCRDSVPISYRLALEKIPTTGSNFCWVSRKECWCHLLPIVFAPFCEEDNADIGLNFKAVLERHITQRTGKYSFHWLCYRH